MSRAAIVAPAGYERISIGKTVVVARTAAVAGLRAALATAPTLHAWAATAPGARAFQGRGTVWGVQLPGVPIDVVVRHAHRGGVLAALRGDRYAWPGRAPWELETALRLQEAGVRTPDVVAFALYPAGPGFCRVDVATRRLPEGAEFPVAWRDGTAEVRASLIAAVGSLLNDLSAAGAQHADLNAKNLHVAREGTRWHAWVLDVDRVRFRSPMEADIAAQNLARLVRSLRKWRDRADLAVTDADLDRLTSLVETGR